jgi:uracil-DNA glycosylase
MCCWRHLCHDSGSRSLWPNMSQDGSIAQPMTSLLAQIRNCTICSEQLAFPPRPVLQLHQKARILLVSQAPGRKVHESGVPFADASGDRLREWMGISGDDFYDARRVAILPMGFCFPGAGKSGDRPPRPECAVTWREKALRQLYNVRLTLVIGEYAQAYHMPDAGPSVTARVTAWRHYWPELVPLPHPSPRNNMWLRRNPWFERDLVPRLQEQVACVLA